MNHIHKSFFTLFVFSFLSFNLSAQYGPQFDNRGFEQWTTREESSVSEPVHWHSGGTATGSFAGFLSSQIEQSNHLRPGSSGSKSVRIFPTSLLGITANGTLTNGRINAGSMSATGSGNYNYTQRAENAFNTPISQLPDSLSIWVCFRSQSSTDKAQVKAVVHGNADYKLIANGTEEPADMHVATAEQRFTRTSTNGGAYNWTRLSIPFINNGPCTDVRYLLLMATTNENPGQGSTNDDLFVDDVLLIYNQSLTLGQLNSNQWTIGSSVTLSFTLTGTMSPDNLNASANQVIAQLSDANGNFSNPTVLGSVTTNTSGSITAQVPNVSAGQYQIRVISTNYPMIGQNIQTVSIIEDTFTVNVSANPNEGGTVSGSGTYSNGQSCTVSATANNGYSFTNWTENGNVVSTNANYTFTVNANRTLVANFTLNSYTITATANPTAGGTVTGGGSYNYGASCALTATANQGYTFTNWTENGNVVSTNANYTFTVNANRTLVANFTANTYTINVSANPSNGGTVSGSGTYTHGQSCTVVATANTGFAFTNWTENGNVVSTNASYTFTVNSNSTLVANFTANTYTINVSANPSNGGTVSGSGTYTYGQSCTVVATANTGFTFTNWTENGNLVSTNTNYTFTVTGNRNLVANFSTNAHTITAIAEPSDGGTIRGAGNYEYGASCTLTATANEGYNFVEWTKDGVQVSTDASYTFTVTASETYVAYFQEDDSVEDHMIASQIFPNPFTSVLSITTEQIPQSIRVYDIYSRLLKEQTVSSQQFDLDLSGLAKGAYLLQIDYGDSRSVHRIMKAE
jgi:hypothetical protein